MPVHNHQPAEGVGMQDGAEVAEEVDEEASAPESETAGAEDMASLRSMFTQPRSNLCIS